MSEWLEAVIIFRLPAGCHHTPGPRPSGEVPEWPNGLDSKSREGFSLPWVRIPPSPPFMKKYVLFHFVDSFLWMDIPKFIPNSARAYPLTSP